MEHFCFPLMCVCKTLELKNSFSENLKKVKGAATNTIILMEDEIIGFFSIPFLKSQKLRANIRGKRLGMTVMHSVL